MSFNKSIKTFLIVVIFNYNKKQDGIPELWTAREIIPDGIVTQGLCLTLAMKVVFRCRSRSCVAPGRPRKNAGDPVILSCG
jgi:hypothetical protein